MDNSWVCVMTADNHVSRGSPLTGAARQSLPAGEHVYYVCKLRGLSAFSGERDSLLRCVGGVGEAVGGVGEAGASYINK